MDTLPPREFEDVSITVPWGQVVGRWYGNRKVRPILALHGWLDNIGTWDTLIPLLPEHIGILCIDLPGHGKSSKYPKGMIYYAIDYVQIIIRFMKEYQWQKVSLLGHSMGAIVVFLYTSLYPRTVDMVMTIDILNPVLLSNDILMKRYAYHIEKSLVENERLNSLALQEPPAYSYDHLERILYEGSKKSVNMENCKYILNRSIAKSTKYPEKYYFARDGRVKFYMQFLSSPGLNLEMCKRIRKVPYFVVKASKSKFINEHSHDVYEIMRQNNPHFEMVEIEGTHHVHLNNAKEVAAALCPFINRHRPVELNSWTVDENNTESSLMAQQKWRQKSKL